MVFRLCRRAVIIMYINTTSLKNRFFSVSLLVLILCLYTPAGFAQSGGPIYSEYGLNMRGSANIPYFVTSKGIRRTFTGVYGASFSPRFDLYKGISIGGSYELVTFTTAANKVSKLNYNEPVMHNNNLGLLIGYDHYSSETTLWSFALEGGKTWIDYTNLSCTEADSMNTIHSFNAFYLKPEASVYFFIEKNVAIGATLSYHFLTESFNPDLACLRTYKDYTAGELEGPISYLNIGFGLYIGITKKKKN